MFELLIKHLRQMEGKEIHIYAKGNYPVKAKTKVQNVAKWQNDGNTRGVTAAHFVEDAAAESGNWSEALLKAMDEAVFGTTIKTNPFAEGERVTITGVFSMDPFKELGKRIADDIGRHCNRIRTGRLKRSFTFRIK